MTLPWQAFREPLRQTLLRTVMIALIVGAVVAASWGGLKRWPVFALLVFWFSFGGHWVEIAFLNWLRPRIAPSRTVQVGARIGTWFVGGTVLGLGVYGTAMVLLEPQLAPQPGWWAGGLALIAAELVAHLGLQLRGQPNFYNGRG